jgi:hypothetical protein
VVIVNGDAEKMGSVLECRPWEWAMEARRLFRGCRIWNTAIEEVWI